MAEFFFNRNGGSENVEPFSEYKYSTQDYYYTQAAAITCTDAKIAACDTQTYPSSGNADAKTEAINNCLCKYKKNVDDYLAKTPVSQTINGVTNDVDEKYNQMTMKNINLGIGLSLMMIYIYTTNY